MKQEIINPFLTSARAVWKEEPGRGPIFSGCSPVNSALTTKDTTSPIRVNGSIDGHVLCGFDIETVGSIASMTSAPPIDCGDDAAMSIVVGLVSHISGQAAVVLENAGFPCEISHPLAFTAVGSMTDTGHIPQLRGHL